MQWRGRLWVLLSTHPILATVDVYLQRLETRLNTGKVDFSLSLSPV